MNPEAGLIGDWEGNFYGTSSVGGNYSNGDGQCSYGSGCGAVFKMDRAGNRTTLYSFTGGTDGAFPGGSLVLDSAGNLYGTAAGGGDLGACPAFDGCGVVFKLDKWGNQTVLYTFTGGADGAVPFGSLILDKTGNLYGTTFVGGDLSACYGCGVVFKLDKAGNETVLYSFMGGADGAYPEASLIFDNAGNLYGTASGGGDLSACYGSGCGVVFKLDPSGKETVLYTFTGDADGAYPYAGLVLDKVGNLYSTTQNGGDLSACSGAGCGVVFKLDKFGKETVLYSFTGGSDGAMNYFDGAGVIRDQAGNLYGVAYQGGDLSACGGAGCGVVFEVGPSGGETVLHTFTGGADGSGPEGTPILDAAGNLYGTTYGGGPLGFGTVYELDRHGKETVYALPSSAGGSAPVEALVRDSAGDLYGSASSGGAYNAGVIYKLDRWGHQTVLHAFTGGADGGGPNDVILDPAGNIYGSANGGAKGSGVVFKLDPLGNETVLYTFTGGADGRDPVGGLVRDPAGSLIGATLLGGNLSACPGSGCGVVFKLDPYRNETVLYNFTGGADGGYPFEGLIRDSTGNFYGTTFGGGNLSANFGQGAGVVFKLDPSGHETVLYAFTGGADGNKPMGSLIRDSAGNLYGTTNEGGGGGAGACLYGGGCGALFKVDPSGKETVLHSFGNGTDGAGPRGDLMFDAAGNIYGVAAYGGADGFGMAFKMDPSGTETALYNFTGGTDGGNPNAGMISDPEGNLYGTAASGGEHGGGVVFKISIY
jgi:uncharacterized repeat protein (TIGR03803 family)